MKRGTIPRQRAAAPSAPVVLSTPEPRITATFAGGPDDDEVIAQMLRCSKPSHSISLSPIHAASSIGAVPQDEESSPAVIRTGLGAIHQADGCVREKA